MLLPCEQLVSPTPNVSFGVGETNCSQGMLHDQTNVLRGSLSFESGSIAYFVSHSILNFGFRFLTIARDTISVETNTISWLFSRIIKQHLTLVICVVNLCFDFANLSDWSSCILIESLYWVAVIHKNSQP